MTYAYANTCFNSLIGDSCSSNTTADNPACMSRALFRRASSPPSIAFTSIFSFKNSVTNVATFLTHVLDIEAVRVAPLVCQCVASLLCHSPQ
jgi:hypothetical protein